MGHIEYQKILATYLTVEERRFVERRIVEEQVSENLAEHARIA